MLGEIRGVRGDLVMTTRACSWTELARAAAGRRRAGTGSRSANRQPAAGAVQRIQRREGADLATGPARAGTRAEAGGAHLRLKRHTAWTIGGTKRTTELADFARLEPFGGRLDRAFIGVTFAAGGRGRFFIQSAQATSLRVEGSEGSDPRGGLGAAVRDRGEEGVHLGGPRFRERIRGGAGAVCTVERGDGGGGFGGRANGLSAGSRRRGGASRVHQRDVGGTFCDRETGCRLDGLTRAAGVSCLFEGGRGRDPGLRSAAGAIGGEGGDASVARAMHY